jgi:PAS domain S-box-containing protein
VATNSKSSQFLDLVGGIIIVIDADQKVSYINKKGCEILGYEREDIVGRDWFDAFLPERLRNDVRTVFRKLMAGELELAEYFDNAILTKAGQERIIGWHNTLLKNDEGKIIGTLSLGEDITDRKMTSEKIVQELRDRITELTSMKMKIPVCSWDKKDLKEAIDKHYRRILIEGKCSECMHILKRTSQVAK